MANNTTKTRKGTTNPSVPMPVTSDVASYDVAKGPVGPKTTKQRGHGAATKGFSSRGPMA